MTPEPSNIEFYAAIHQTHASQIEALKSQLAEAERKLALTKAENERLSAAIVSNILPSLLDDDETAALVDFIKSLRDGSALAALGEPNP